MYSPLSTNVMLNLTKIIYAIVSLFLRLYHSLPLHSQLSSFRVKREEVKLTCNVVIPPSSVSSSLAVAAMPVPNISETKTSAMPLLSSHLSAQDIFVSIGNSMSARELVLGLGDDGESSNSFGIGGCVCIL
jgi:hypothetical protein